MNQKTRKTLTTLALASVLMGASLSAQAEDSMTGRVVTGVGRVIAAQGNAALVAIKEELKEKLADTLKPLVPEPQPTAKAQPVSAAMFEQYVADELACPAI